MMKNHILLGSHNTVVFHLLSVFFLSLLLFSEVQAQRRGVKTNALGWLTCSPNMGGEFRVSRFNTINLEASAGYLTLGSRYQRHALVMPEVRHWFSARPQTRHFCGVMALFGVYNVKFSSDTHKGLAMGLGLTYGYSFVLKPRWSLELTAGAGFLHRSEQNKQKNGFAPLKVGVSLVYFLK